MRGRTMVTPQEQLAEAMEEIGELTDRLEVVKEKRDEALHALHDEGYSFEAIARMAGDMSHVGVFRAVRRRKQRELGTA